jgi:peptide/nickel transport system substrate-binding protein
MRRRHRRLNWIAFAAAAILTAGASTQAVSQDQSPKHGGTLNVGFVSDIKTLDPTFSVQFGERQILYPVYNTLVRFGPDFSLNPELAESWSIENDGSRLVLNLRQGVKFHDGTDFDASVVKFNLDRRLDPDVGSPQAKQLGPVIDNVEVIDDHTVAINLKQPSPSILALLGERPGFMVSPAAVEKYGEDLGSHPVGTGPFVFKEWVRGSHVTLEKNPNYWEDGKPYLDSIVYRDIAGAVVGLQRLRTGEVDWVGEIPPQTVKQIEGAEGIKLDPITVGRWYSLQWHVNEPPFDNKDLRHAIAYAIDRDRINQIVMAGKATLSDGPTPPVLWWYSDALPSYDRDPAKAKELLAKAGYGDGFEYVLSTPQVSVYQQINQLVQEQLAEVGIKLTLDPVASGEWYDRVVKKITNWTPTRWTQRPDPDGLLYILFHRDGYANTTSYDNPEVNALLDEGRKTFDQAKRKEIYAKAQQLIMDDIPMLPLFFAVEYAAMNERVQGFEWIPDQIPRFRDLWLAE